MDHIDMEDTMQADHLSIALEANRQLRAENADYRAALGACNKAFDYLSDCIQGQFENGVKWLNQDAAMKFSASYPEIRKGLDGLLDASIGIDEILEKYAQPIPCTTADKP